MPRPKQGRDPDFPWIEEMEIIFVAYDIKSIRARKSSWRHFCRFIKAKNMMKKRLEAFGQQGSRLGVENGLGVIPSYEIVIEEGIEFIWVQEWISSMVALEYGFQTMLNYFVAVVDFLVAKGVLYTEAWYYHEYQLRMFHRQILTMVKNEPHSKARPFTLAQMFRLPDEQFRIAALALQLGVRSQSLKNISPDDVFRVEDNGTSTWTIWLDEIKYCPSNRSRFIELSCCCQGKHQKAFCFVHTLKFPKLPITSKALASVCRILGTSSHTFRRTLALILRCIHERFGLIDVDLVNVLFYWRDNSRMYIQQYTKDYESVLKMQLPMVWSVIDRCVMPSRRMEWELIKKMNFASMVGGRNPLVSKAIKAEIVKRDVKEIPRELGVVEKWSTTVVKPSKDDKKPKYGPALLYNEENMHRWPQRLCGWVFEGQDANLYLIRGTADEEFFVSFRERLY